MFIAKIKKIWIIVNQLQKIHFFFFPSRTALLGDFCNYYPYSPFYPMLAENNLFKAELY